MCYYNHLISQNDVSWSEEVISVEMLLIAGHCVVGQYAHLSQ